MSDAKGKGRTASEGGWCLICLGEVEDRTVLPECMHSRFCFDCIVRWVGVRRVCPLCQGAVGAYVIHAIRSDSDYVRHFLPSSSQPDSPPPEDVGLAGRRRIYQRGLYAKHVGANRHTRYRAVAPSQIHNHANRIAAFASRDLAALPPTTTDRDIPFLTQYTVSILKLHHPKSHHAEDFLRDFLGGATNHFLHEMDAFIRSGRRTPEEYDASRWTQYPDVADRREELLSRLAAERRLLQAQSM